MARQYYLLDENDVRIGPLTAGQVVAKMRDGEIGRDQLAWYQGIKEGWTPVGELVEFEEVEEVEEEPLLEEKGKAVAKNAAPEVRTLDGVVATLPPARPWPRLGARIVDLAMYSTLLLTIIDKTSIDTLSDSWSKVQMVALFGIILIEAGLLMLIGTTPGKGLFGIHVRRKSDGARLGLGSAVGRTLLVWILGMGFGQPILLPLTIGVSYYFLKRDGVALWDRGRDVQLKSAGTSAFRLVCAGFLVMSWLSLAMLVGMDQVVTQIREGKLEVPAWYREQLEKSGFDLGPAPTSTEEKSAPTE